jgi:hypothetical protein
VHTDARAGEAAQALAARAFTIGSHVVFGHGAFAPATSEGRRLAAHEFAHVAQQAARAPGTSEPAVGELRVGDLDAEHEHEAERVAALAAAGPATLRRPAAATGKGKAYPTDRPPPEEAPVEAGKDLITEEADVEEEPEAKKEAADGTMAPVVARDVAQAAPGEVIATGRGKDKERIVIREVPAVAPVPVGLAGKTKCPAPVKAPVAFSTKGSTAAQIAAMSPCTWGITSPDPLKVLTTTCRDGAVWRLRVRSVLSDIRTFSRQLPGQAEPTVGSSTAGNFCAQVTDLDALGQCPGNWYMLSAVRAHEAVHVTEWRTSFNSNWPAQKAAIEGLSVPAAGATKNRGPARAALRALPGFTNALQTSNASGNFPAFWGIADPNANTNAAERVIVAPRIRALCVNAQRKGWAPGGCPVCVANGVT